MTGTREGQVREMAGNPQVLAPLVILYFARNVANDQIHMEKIKVKFPQILWMIYFNQK